MATNDSPNSGGDAKERVERLAATRDEYGNPSKPFQCMTFTDRRVMIMLESSLAFAADPCVMSFVAFLSYVLFFLASIW